MSEGHIVVVVMSAPGRMGFPEQYEVAPAGALVRLARAATSLVVDGVGAVGRLGPRTVVLGHWLLPGGVAAHLVAQVAGAEAMTVAHSSAARMVASLPGPLARSLARLGLGPAGTPWIASCQDVADALLKVAPAWRHGLSVLPMPTAPPRRIGLPPAGPPWHIATLGRLVPIKGLSDLVRAVAGRPVHLHICGEGPERAPLTALTESLGVPAHFHGVVLGADKERVLSSVHGLAQPSRVQGARAEGSPVAVHEALGYGLPVLVTATGGLPEAAGAGVHVIAEPGAQGLGEAWPVYERALVQHWQHRRFAVG